MSVWDHLDRPEQLMPLLAQPANEDIAETVERLIEEPRRTPERPDLRSVQEHLADVIVGIESRYRAARKAEKRGQSALRCRVQTT